MEIEEAEQWVDTTYRLIMRRIPSMRERSDWVNKLCRDIIHPIQLIKAMEDSAEYRQWSDASRNIKQFAPAGHYYSPIVDPQAVQPYYAASKSAGISALREIICRIDEMCALINCYKSCISESSFGTDETSRYKKNNSFFPTGDAYILKMMLSHLKPKRIMEIGSGFSSALMLDVCDELEFETALTCIDPNPERLYNLLRPEDLDRINIKRCLAQDLKEEDVLCLEAKDILFIDSTHVLKTCSDVCHQLFNLLPALKSGVVIHFHDIAYPFEYPKNWIFEDNHSWNEAYALRAFLMYNQNFKIKFWGDMLKIERPEVLKSILPSLSEEVFASLWLERL